MSKRAKRRKNERDRAKRAQGGRRLPDLVDGIGVECAGSRLSRVFHDLDRVYAELPETHCKVSRCVACCMVQDPVMNYVEFLRIWRGVVLRHWAPEKIRALIMEAMRRFLTTPIEREPLNPCLFVDKETPGCGIYRVRPFNCRGYGQTPAEEWTKRLEALTSKMSAEEVERLPLQSQCQQVEIKGEPLSAEKFDDVFTAVHLLDRAIGISANLVESLLGEGEVSMYLTFPDHLVFHLMGNEWAIGMQRSLVLVLDATIQMKDIVETSKLRAWRKDLLDHFEKSLDGFVDQLISDENADPGERAKRARQEAAQAEAPTFDPFEGLRDCPGFQAMGFGG